MAGISRSGRKKARYRKELTIGQMIIEYDSLFSTNDLTKQLARNGAPSGMVIIAGKQTHGRGRGQRAWTSPVGGLWMSILLRPKISPRIAQMYTLMTGVAVAETLNERFGIDAKLKWPNDVIVGGKKICGILTETAITGNKIDYMVLGIGINVNNRPPKTSPFQATSLLRLTGKKTRLEQLRHDILTKFIIYNTILNSKPSNLIHRWTALSDTIGRYVRIVDGNETLTGKALRLRRDGALLIKPSGEKARAVVSADYVHVL